MDIKIKLIENIDKAISYLTIMRNAAEKQGILNANFIDSYLSALYYMKEKVLKNEKIDRVHKSKWDNHMGGVHRYFEAHPLEDLLYDISDDLRKNYF